VNPVGRIQRHLEEARIVSLLSDFERVHVGCVITYCDKVIASGYNNTKTDPIQERYNRYRDMVGNKVIHMRHAEIMALKKIVHLGLDMKRVVVYNWREYKDGTPALSRPCSACMNFMKDLGITKVVYSTDNANGFCIERVQ